MDRPGRSDPEVRAATEADVPSLAKMLALAFDDDPVFLWWVRRDERRAAALEEFFELMLRQGGIPHGEVITTPELDSCALWLPPGKWQARTSWWELVRSLPKLVRLTSLRRLPRAFTLVQQTERSHPDTGPHFYLFFLATLPSRQGKGLGSALLKTTLSRLDREGIGAYLEASSQSNVRLYERHGFRTIQELHIPRSGPSLWCMWREPASKG